MNWGILLAGVAVAGVVAGVTYRDARRVPVPRARALAALVFLSLGGTAALSAAVPSIPPPGLLVIALIGPAVYVFEREDARSGEEQLDPYSLPGGSDEDRR
ncbi:MAG: hypothetical protein V5A46_07870, partial [Haloferacaceae archaeon]